jgi:hypothetical protein
MAAATPKPEAELPSLDDLEAALAEAEAAAAPGMDATTEVLPPPEGARLEPPDEADGAFGDAADGGAAAPGRRLSPRPPIGGAVPLTYEEALRQALAAEQAPDDAYEGVWMPKAAVAPDSHQEIIARLTQLEEPAESSVPDVQFAAEGGLGPGADAPREEPKVGFFSRLFGRGRR